MGNLIEWQSLQKSKNGMREIRKGDGLQQKKNLRERLNDFSNMRVRLKQLTCLYIDDRAVKK